MPSRLHFLGSGAPSRRPPALQVRACDSNPPLPRPSSTYSHAPCPCRGRSTFHSISSMFSHASIWISHHLFAACRSRRRARVCSCVLARVGARVAVRGVLCASMRARCVVVCGWCCACACACSLLSFAGACCCRGRRRPPPPPVSPPPVPPPPVRRPPLGPCRPIPAPPPEAGRRRRLPSDRRRRARSAAGRSATARSLPPASPPAVPPPSVPCRPAPCSCPIHLLTTFLLTYLL